MYKLLWGAITQMLGMTIQKLPQYSLEGYPSLIERISLIILLKGSIVGETAIIDSKNITILDCKIVQILCCSIDVCWSVFHGLSLTCGTFDELRLEAARKTRLGLID